MPNKHAQISVIILNRNRKMPNKRITPDSSTGHSILGSLAEIEHFAVTIEEEAKSIQVELKQIRNEIQGMDMDMEMDDDLPKSE